MNDDQKPSWKELEAARVNQATKSYVKELDSLFTANGRSEEAEALVETPPRFPRHARTRRGLSEFSRRTRDASRNRIALDLSRLPGGAACRRSARNDAAVGW